MNKALKLSLLRWSAYLGYALLAIATLTGGLKWKGTITNYAFFEFVHINSGLWAFLLLSLHAVLGMERILRGWAYWVFGALVGFLAIATLALFYL